MPVKMLWNPYVPTKVGFFVLRSLVGKDSDYELALKEEATLLLVCALSVGR